MFNGEKKTTFEKVARSLFVDRPMQVVLGDI